MGGCICNWQADIGFYNLSFISAISNFLRIVSIIFLKTLTLSARRRAAEGKRRKKTEEEELAGEVSPVMRNIMRLNQIHFRTGANMAC